MSRQLIASLMALVMAGIGVALTPVPINASSVTLVANHRERSLFNGTRVHEDELPVGSGTWFAIAHASNGTPVTNDASPADLTATVTTGNTAVVTIEYTGVVAGVFTSSQSDTYEANQHNDGVAHSIDIGVACNLVGGSTTFTWTLAATTVNNLQVSEYSGAADTNCLDGTMVSGENASETWPFTPSSVTLTAGGIVFCALASNDNPAMTVGTERSESAGNSFYLNTGERTSSGACTWSGASAQIHILIGIEESGGAVFPFGILPNIPIKGGGLWTWFLERVR